MLAIGSTPAVAFDPAAEGSNYAKIGERYQHDTASPAFQQLLLAQNAMSESQNAQILAADPERNFLGNLCAHKGDGCAGDVRYNSWQADGYGLRIPVSFVARDGAVIVGHVWATKAGPALRPAIVITNGSVQAPEELYAFAASTLAKKGFVVLTYDPQTQGQSDTFGEGADQSHAPTQTATAFYEGTQDGLDFLLSTPAAPYRPRFPSDGLMADHKAKQQRRVAVKLADAYNPLSSMVDPARVGIAGHSLGAGAVSCVARIDTRVKAVVAWDNLGTVAEGTQCAGVGKPGPLRVPALGMSADYFLVPTPYNSDPDPQTKNAASHEYSAANIDTAQVNIRGGTHYEFSFIPDPAFGATLRGIDEVAWYTGAWFDKYVKGDPTADARLLTTRWLDDSAEKAVDNGGDGNVYSFYLRSRIDLRTADGTRVTCEDLRKGPTGCAPMKPDGLGAYSYLAESRSKDAPGSRIEQSPFTGPAAPAAGGVGGPSTFAARVRLSVPRLASRPSARPRVVARVRPPAGAAAAALVERYGLQVSDGSRPFRSLPVGTGEPSVSVPVADGHRYRFRARAVARGGRAGPWVSGVTLVPRDERTALRFAAGWTRLNVSSAWRGTLTRTTRRGATARGRVTGSRLYVIGRRSPRGGVARLLIDGRARGSISFRGTSRARAIVRSAALVGRQAHTVSIVTGPTARAVELDAIATAP